MDRARFSQLLEAYGGDLARWPQGERAEAAAFATEHGAEFARETAQARLVDASLEAVWGETPDIALLQARVLKAARQGRASSFDRRALWALAACAVFGVLLGFGGGQLAPWPDFDESYFAMAFEAPIATGEDG